MRTLPQDDTGVVIDLFSHRAYCRRNMRSIDRIRFAAILEDGRLYIRLIHDGADREWLQKLTFTVITENGQSVATGVAKIVEKNDGLNIATNPLSPKMQPRRVTEHSTIVVESSTGERKSFEYRPVFIQKAL